MLICNTQFNDSQLNSLNQLSALCMEADGGLPAIYPHLLIQKRATENNILYYEHDNLLGFLSAYFFYEEACEISLVVNPAHRRQAIATQMLKAILPLLITKKMNTVYFSTPSTVNSVWLSKLGFLYKNSEYHMQRHGYDPILLNNEFLDIRKARDEDISDLCAIDAACFPEEQANMQSRFNNLLKDNNYTLLIAFHNNVAVGKAHIRWQEKGALLSDIAIIPRCQGQGWGSELLIYCINRALTLGKTSLALDVETSNRNALNLYTRHGFKTTNSYDYWAISLEKLRTLLHFP